MSVETVWFCLLAAALTAYVVLDGYDLGAGILHLFVARTPEERALVLRTVGPTWDGNEVWLLAAGGTLFSAFPTVYATAFSGFYLPLMMVLWLLIGRAMGIELRHQIPSTMWTAAWDAVFALSSLALAVFLGAALGNVVEGVPIDASGRFFEPLWTDFKSAGIVTPYALLAGATAAAALALHGALWIAHKTGGPVQRRARRAALGLWWGVAAAVIALTLLTRAVQPHAARRFAEAPWGIVFPLAAAAGLGLARGFTGAGRERAAFAASAVFLASLMASVAFSLWPLLLPSTPDASRSLTVWTAAAEPATLKRALGWWLPGIALAAGYAVLAHVVFRGKVESGDGYGEAPPSKSS